LWNITFYFNFFYYIYRIKKLNNKSSIMRKSNWLTQTVLVVMVFLMGMSELAAQETVDAVLKARGLSDKDKIAAVKTFMPRGGRDEYFGIVGTGNSGTMIVYGIPSMRIYKYVGVFTPEPWQGFGFDDESSLLLKKSSLDNRIPTYGDMRFPAFSEMNGKYDGKYAFFSDGANARVALLGLDDFETKQVLSNPILTSVFPEVAVTPNTDFVIQSGQFPTPWASKEADMAKAKNGITFWAFHRIEKEGEHKGRILKEKSFTVEFPAYTLDYNDVGRGAGADLLVGLASKDGKNYVYALDYKKAAAAGKKSFNSFNYVPFDAVKAAVSFIELPAGANMVKTSPDGKYFVVAADNVLVLDAAKIKANLGKNVKADAVMHKSVAIGKGVIDVAFDYRDGVAYASAHDDKKVVRFNFVDGKVMDNVALSYAPSYLTTPQGMSAEPHSNYLIAVDKEAYLPNLPKTGPVRPSVQHLIDIASDSKMVETYTMTLPQANVYGNIAILRTTIKPIIRYATGTNSRTGEASPFRAVAGQEKIEREGNRVHVFGTLIRSHITPEIVEVNEGDIVTFHLTNLERAEDETHGFTVDTYGKHGSFEPGKTASLTFVADKPGVFPYYCTEFCSALHLEMEGILLVKPKGYKGVAGEMAEKLTPEQLEKYHKDYDKKIEVIKETGDIIGGVVKFLKENHYEKYPYVKSLVIDALDQLGPENGGKVKEKYEKFAKEGKWKQAFLWAEQYWQYQVKTADVGLRAKKLLEEKMAQDK
jgi:nitrous-oxide reductase